MDSEPITMDPIGNETVNETQRFVDTQLRPLCEQMRAFAVQVESMSVDWYGGVSGEMPPGDYDDGRPEDGLHPMTDVDITNAVANLLAAVAPYSAEVIAKPCVRALEAD